MHELVGQEQAWNTWISKHWNNIKNNNVRTYKPVELQNPELNLSFILKVPEGVNEEIFRRLKNTIPDSLFHRILLQQWQWYHMTIQWAPEKEINEDKRPQVIRKIREIVEATPILQGEIRFPYLGDGGLMGAFFTTVDGQVATLKRAAQSIWNEEGLPLGLPEIYDETAYISMSRFLGEFTHEERTWLREIPLETIPDVTFNTALVVLNDKIMTPERIQTLLNADFKIKQ